MKKFWVYLDRTKFSRYKNYALLLILLIFIFTSAVPSYTYAKKEMKNVPSKDDISALMWLKRADDGKVLGLFEEGNLISYFSNKKNVWDSNFLMIRDIDYIEDDVETIFTAISETKGIELLEKYNVRYIFYGNVRKKYGKIPYLSERCFKEIYKNDNVIIYEVLCKLK